MTKKHPLVKFSATDRFGGGVYESSAGQPMAATTGAVLVVLGAKTVDDMAAILLASRPRPVKTAASPLPPVGTAASVIPRGPAVGGSEPMHVSLATPPNPVLLQYAIERAAQRVSEAVEALPAIEKSLRQAKDALAAERAAKRRGRIGRLCDEVARWRQRADEARKDTRSTPQGPEAHAVAIGDVAYNLDLIRAALQVMGATEGRLVATGSYSAGILTCEQGMALVMPFRTAGLAVNTDVK